jgi:hypothetical protein
MRLADAAGTTAGVRRLAAPAVQVLRAMAALPAGAGRGELARLLGVDVADRDLMRVMTQLAEGAYAWEGPSGRLLAAPNVLEGWPHPLGLGSPAAFLLEAMPFPRVKEIARRLGLSLAGGKQAVTERLLDRYPPAGPAVKTVPDDPAAVDQEAATAAGHLLERAGALLDHATGTPVAIRASGGVVTVTDVVCVVRATDEALLAEIAGHRRLAKLGLRLLAPTVLASPRPASETLLALREAGTRRCRRVSPACRRSNRRRQPARAGRA